MTQPEAIEKMLSGLYLVGMNDQALELDQEITKFDKELKR